MNNYRITFLHNLEIDYWNKLQPESGKNFADLRRYHQLIKGIIILAEAYQIEHIWWFFEPYVELTFLSDNDRLACIYIEHVKKILENLYAIRDPLYREIADHVIETGKPSVNQLVNTLIMQLEPST